MLVPATPLTSSLLGASGGKHTTAHADAGHLIRVTCSRRPDCRARPQRRPSVRELGTRSPRNRATRNRGFFYCWLSSEVLAGASSREPRAASRRAVDFGRLIGKRGEAASRCPTKDVM